MLERQGLTFLKRPFGEDIENSRPPSSELGGLLFPVLDAHTELSIIKSILEMWRNGMDFYTERAILST